MTSWFPNSRHLRFAVLSFQNFRKHRKLETKKMAEKRVSKFDPSAKIVEKIFVTSNLSSCLAFLQINPNVFKCCEVRKYLFDFSF